MEDIAAIVCEKLLAEAQKSASASRVVLNYVDVGNYFNFEIVIRQVSHGRYSFNHSSKEKIFTVTTKNVSTVIDMIVTRLREIIDCKYATSREVKVVHEIEDGEPFVLWRTYKYFQDTPHDEAQFKQLRIELEEATRVAWDGVVDVRDVCKDQR